VTEVPRARTPFGHGGRHPLAGRTILQVIPELDAGGAERTAIDVAAGLADIGARALIASEGGRLVGELQAVGGTWVPFAAGTKNPVSMTINVRRLARIAHDERVDLIHARSRAPAWVALGSARALGLPFVTTFHGSYSERSVVKRLYNSVMARGDLVIANSAYTAGLIRKSYPWAEPRIRIVHRGTDLSRFAVAAVAPERVDGRSAGVVGAGPSAHRASRGAPHELEGPDASDRGGDIVARAWARRCRFRAGR
jgi:glycosyltransferase involved in cell wall biosynthesis